MCLTWMVDYAVIYVQLWVMMKNMGKEKLNLVKRKSSNQFVLIQHKALCAVDVDTITVTLVSEGAAVIQHYTVYCTILTKW